VEINRALLSGVDVNFVGKHFEVRSARLFDVPETPPPLGIRGLGSTVCSHGR
jgi:hypothetical protein